MKFKVLLYNLKCSLRDWRDFNLAPSEKIAKSPNFNPSQNFYSYGNMANDILYSRKFSKGLIFKNFDSQAFSKIFFEIHIAIMLSCMCISRMLRSGPQIMALLKYFKHIEPSKE